MSQKSLWILSIMSYQRHKIHIDFRGHTLACTSLYYIITTIYLVPVVGSILYEVWGGSALTGVVGKIGGRLEACPGSIHLVKLLLDLVSVLQVCN